MTATTKTTVTETNSYLELDEGQEFSVAILGIPEIKTRRCNHQIDQRWLFPVLNLKDNSKGIFDAPESVAHPIVETLGRLRFRKKTRPLRRLAEKFNLVRPVYLSTAEAKPRFTVSKEGYATNDRYETTFVGSHNPKAVAEAYD